MGKLSSSFLAVALTVPFTAVAANFPPKFNVGPGCKAAAAINQAMDLSVGQNFQSCMDDEEAARQQLVQSWSSFTPQDQVRCVGQTQINGMPSYVEVLGCLQVTAKSPAQPAETKSMPGTNPDVKTGEKINERTHQTTNEKANDDLNSTIEALRADAASSATRMAALQKENVDLSETVGTLKTSLATSQEKNAELEKRNTETNLALRKAEQQRISAETQLHDIEDASVVRRAREVGTGEYWQVLAYAGIGGLITVLMLNALFWIRWKRAKRAASAGAKSAEGSTTTVVSHRAQLSRSAA